MSLTAMSVESNSQALARTLLLSALHRITRISNRKSLVKYASVCAGRGFSSCSSINVHRVQIKFPMMNNSANELSRRVTITNDLGLHARAAAKIAKLAQNVKSNVWIIKDGKKADASSIIDILTLVCPKGSIITLQIDNQSDLEILNDLVQLIKSSFGE